MTKTTLVPKLRYEDIVPGAIIRSAKNGFVRWIISIQKDGVLYLTPPDSVSVHLLDADNINFPEDEYRENCCHIDGCSSDTLRTWGAQVVGTKDVTQVLYAFADRVAFHKVRNAAPDLLAACRLMLDYDLYIEFGSHDPETAVAKCNAALFAARAAVAKAMGGRK